MLHAIRTLLAASVLTACASTALTGEQPRGMVLVESSHCYFGFPIIHFEQGSAIVPPEVGSAVAELATAMKRDPNTFVFVELAGYASVGESDGVPLSTRRANAVRAELVALGVDATHLRARGYGPYCSLSEKGEADNPEAASNDRRVEIKVIRTKQGDTRTELGCLAAAEAGLVPDATPNSEARDVQAR